VSDVPAPDQRETPDPGPRYDAMQVLQSMMELQKDISALSSKTDRLITDVEKIDKKTNDLSHTLSWAKGFAVAAVILIPICTGFVWWLAGNKFNELRDQLLGAKPPVMTQPTLPPHH
jgi:hypothetical protein